MPSSVRGHSFNKGDVFARAAGLALAAGLLGCVGPRAERARKPDLAPPLVKPFEPPLAPPLAFHLLEADQMAERPELGAAERARAYCFSARMRTDAGDGVGARERYKLALKEVPDDPETLLRLAQASREEPERARGVAARALAAADGAAPGLRAEILRVSAEIALDMQDPAAAVRDLKLALALDPADLDALRMMIRASGARGTEARGLARAAQRAAAEKPAWLRPAAYRFAARVWRDAGADAEAAEADRRALALDPDDMEALRDLVQIEWRNPGRGLARVDPPALDPRPAEDFWAEWTPEALTRAEALDPDGVEALRLRAARALSKGKIEEAQRNAALLPEALLRAPLWQLAAGLRFAARLQHALGWDAEALISLNTALRYEPNTVQTWRQLEHFRGFLGAPSLPPSLFIFKMEYMDAANLRLKLEDVGGAERAIDLALKSGPNDQFTLDLKEKIMTRKAGR
jgi:tetratricopeptide (TPR) repeat protein